MSLTAISIFSAPLSQAETVESLSFSTPLTKANEVSKTVLSISKPVKIPNSIQIGQMSQLNLLVQVALTSLTENMVNKMVEHLSFLNHLAAVLDNWDPRIIDGIAAKHHVVVFDNRGVGASTGEPAKSIEQMADDAITFIQAKGFKQVDLFGFSMGGMISQEIVLKQPNLVRKMILSGTGPAGGTGISTVGRVSNWDLVRGMVTGQDPKVYLFFTRTENGKASAKAFIQRINERTENRDKEITISAYRAQLKALKKNGEVKTC